MAWPDGAQVPGDLHPDGDRFIMTRSTEAEQPWMACTVANWFTELLERAGGS